MADGAGVVRALAVYPDIADVLVGDGGSKVDVMAVGEVIWLISFTLALGDGLASVNPATTAGGLSPFAVLFPKPIHQADDAKKRQISSKRRGTK